jgi:hypothetical protein
MDLTREHFLETLPCFEFTYWRDRFLPSIMIAKPTLYRNLPLFVEFERREGGDDRLGFERNCDDLADEALDAFGIA